MTAEVGQTLRRAREEQQLSLEEISKELHIRVAYLQALEAEDFNRLPAPTQARGFLRLYSDYLHLPTKELVEAFRKAQNPDLYAQTEEDLNDSPDLGSAVDDTVTLILQEIGHDLKKQRENLGLSKADVEAHTHIPDHYVNYLESGDINQFPSPTQARGMLANYANFLDLDSDDIMLRYANALQTELFTRQAEQSAEDAAAPSRVRPKFRAPQVPQWVRMFLSPDLILVSTIGIVILIITVWGIGQITRSQSGLAPLPTAPSIVDALLPTATEEPTPTATLQLTPTFELLDVDTPTDETEVPTIQAASAGSIQLLIVARQRAFLRVTADTNNVVYEGRILPGQSVTVSGQEQIELLTGNAAALQVYYNNQDMGILGIFGEVVDLIYTTEGVAQPTSQPTPTLPPEDQVTATPTITPTTSGEDNNPELPPAENTPIP